MSTSEPSQRRDSLQPNGFGTLIVIAKNPVPGLVKTRLTPHFSPAQAAELAAAALADTLDVVAQTPAKRRLLVLDGDETRWQQTGLEIVAQQGAGLDERLAHAFSLVRKADGACLLVGMDTPQLTPELLARPAGPPSGVDAWIGPADDGGFWALGFAQPPDPAWLRGVPMSQDDTGAVLRARLVEAGLTVADLPTLRDVDTPGDVAAVAKQARHSRFALLAARIDAA